MSASSASRSKRLLLRILIALGTILFLTLVVGYIVRVYFDRQIPIYKSSAKLITDSSAQLPYGLTTGLVFNPPNLDIAAYREAALSAPVLARALRTAGYDAKPSNIDQFRRVGRVSFVVGPRNISDIFVLTVSDADPVKASKLAGAWANSLKVWSDELVRSRMKDYRINLESQLQSVVQAIGRLSRTQPQSPDLSFLQGIRGNVLRDIQLVRGLESTAQSSLSVLEGASTPIQPAYPQTRRNSLLAMIFAFVALVGLWLLYEAWRNPVPSVSEVPPFQPKNPASEVNFVPKPNEPFEVKL